MPEPKWHDLGPVESLKRSSLQEIKIDRVKIALSYQNGKFGAVSGVCNHVGGPLGKGHLEGDFIVCPWHHYKFNRILGTGEPGFEDDRVPQYELKEENGHLFVNLEAITTRHKKAHAPHPLSRPVQRSDGPLRVVGLSTTVMDPAYPRYSTSDELLQVALEHAKSNLGAESKMIRLYELKFRNCEGYYSKSSHACTWPCSITQMDEQDQLDQVYEAVVHWADVVLVASPIRWGSASSLYFKMVERMNCIQNQITLQNRVLIKNKVASFIITGGQDNIQEVAGQMLGFFAELGFIFPPFPYIAHSLGWTAENMERNVAFVAKSKELREGAKALVKRSLELSKVLLKETQMYESKIERGGRKGHRTDAEDHFDAGTKK